jgi:hypothetical protein
MNGWWSLSPSSGHCCSMISTSGFSACIVSTNVPVWVRPNS